MAQFPPLFPTGVLPWTMTRREILIFRTIAFCPRLWKVYVVSGTPSQHPRGVSKSNEKVTCVPKKTYQLFSLLYNQKINLSSKNLKSCHTLFLLLKSHFSKIKYLSLHLVFSPWNLNPICPKFSIQISTMLLHTFLFTPNRHHPTTPSHRLSLLSFFHPPLHYPTAIPKYPWSNNHKEPPPFHISH